MSGQPRRPHPRAGDTPSAPAPERTKNSDDTSGRPVESTGTGGTPHRRRRRRRPKKRSTSADQPTALAPPKGSQPRKKQKKKPNTPTKAELAARATSTRKEVSSGGVVYRRADDGALEILLAARRTLKGNIAWGLAKGHIEEGESPEDAAIREVREETGFDAMIEASLGITKYFYVWEKVRIRKTVHFFLMHATNPDPGDRDDEMEEIRWFPLERALKRAAYRGERDVLLRAADILG